MLEKDEKWMDFYREEILSRVQGDMVKKALNHRKRSLMTTRNAKSININEYDEEQISFTPKARKMSVQNSPNFRQTKTINFLDRMREGTNRTYMHAIGDFSNPAVEKWRSELRKKEEEQRQRHQR